MRKKEEQIIDFIISKKEILFVAIISLLGLFIRFELKYFESEDYLVFLSKWYQEIADNGGLSALSSQVGNYPVVYQTIIALLTYLPISPLYAYKFVSIVFDYLLGFEALKLVKKLTGNKRASLIAYAAVILSPIVILNSATWGQCDSIYTFFIVLCLRKLIEKNYRLAFVFYGLAFSFKLQSILLLPFLVIIYLIERKFSITDILLFPLTVYITYIPAFLCGRSLLEPFTNYVVLTEYEDILNMNISNIWVLINGDFATLYWVAMGLTLLILGAALLWFLDHIRTDLSDHYLELAIWSIWTCVMFLPSMHDRYLYPVEILLIIVVLAKRKHFVELLVMMAATLQAYGNYLFYLDIPSRWIMAMLMLGVYVYYSRKLFKEIEGNE